MMVEEFTGQGPGAIPSKTTWYTYNCAGNVTRVVSRDETVATGFGSGGGWVAHRGTRPDSVGSGGGADSTGVGSDADKSIASQSGGPSLQRWGTPARVPPGNVCPAGSSKYTATRFGYAKNGQSVTFAMGEEWCWDETPPTHSTTDYSVTWAREFLSDGARQRFLEIEFDPAALTSNTFTEVARKHTEYDGDQPYKSWSTGTGGYTETGYELGLARIDNMASAPVTSYYHTDMLGTARFMTDANGVMSEQAVYTAFGERVSGGVNRFGYVGAFGCQSASSDTPGDPYVSGMTYQHVGARYYDPTTGRFLQRDPIRIRGGLNVYEYVSGMPTMAVDPEGLIGFVGSVGVGVAAGSSIGGAVGGVAGGIAGSTIPGAGTLAGVGAGAKAGWGAGAVAGGLCGAERGGEARRR